MPLFIVESYWPDTSSAQDAAAAERIRGAPVGVCGGPAPRQDGSILGLDEALGEGSMPRIAGRLPVRKGYEQRIDGIERRTACKPGYICARRAPRYRVCVTRETR
jgi:hypothetical protein